MANKATQLFHLPKFLDERGNLSFFENEVQLPFPIKRVHWIYDVPGGEERGELAYKETEEFVVALSGSFDVMVDDGRSKQVFSLNRSYMGVYVPKGCWRSIVNFSTNSLAMIAASTYYDSNDVVRDYDMFQACLSLKKVDSQRRDNNAQTLDRKTGQVLRRGNTASL